jgi:hypothetical protein
MQLVFASAIFTVTPVVASAAPYNSDNAAMVRLSYKFGYDKRPSEPWVGVHFSQSQQAQPWEARNEAESSVSFNLATPEIAFADQGNRTVLALEKTQNELMVGCGPEPEKNHRNNTGPILASVVVVGVVTYLVMSEEAAVKRGC